MSKTRSQRIVQRTVVGGALSLVLAGMLYASSLPGGDRMLLGGALFLSCVGCFEAVRMGLFGSKVSLPAMWVAVLVSGGIWAAVYDTCACSCLDLSSCSPAQVYWGTLLISPLVAWAAYLAVGLVHRPKRPDQEAPGSAGPRFFALLCITTALTCMYPVRLFAGVQGLIALIVLSKIGDIFGYYCGNMWGKHHPFPKLSPGKTTEGCLGSFVAGCAAGVLFQMYGMLPAGEVALLPGLWAGGLAGATLNLASQAGDLFESSWKRQTSVKDSGTWFGPSGGMLDLVDSLLLSAPVAALTWPWLFQWTFVS